MHKKTQIGQTDSKITNPVPPDLIRKINKYKLKFSTDGRKCAKQEVIAVIVKGDKYWFGSNWCANPQQTCPRGNMPSGQGYELCTTVCKQSHHAEVDVCTKAGEEAKGADIYLYGHTYCCEPCKARIKAAGIKNTFIGTLPAIVIEPIDKEK